MKVLILTTHLDIGGVPVYTVNLAKGLQRRGVTVYVASSGGELVKMLEDQGICHLDVNIRTKCEFHPKVFLAYVELLTFVNQTGIDVIHAQTRVAQVMARMIARESGIAYVSTCHGFFKEKRLSRKLLDAWGDRVIAISDAVKEHLRRDFNVDEKRISLIYNGVDIESFTDRSTQEEKTLLKTNLGLGEGPVIGSISRLSPVKGLQYLLFAMKDLIRDVPEARLLVIGDGPAKNDLVKLAKTLAIDAHVFFAASTTETARFLAIMDIFIFYSLQEGLGLSLLEALASGKPCIASMVGGVPSVVKDGETGILVPPRDSHALQTAIGRLLKDNERRASLAAGGLRCVRERFSLDAMIDRVIDVYTKCHTY